MDKPTKMTQQQFGAILIETLTCCGLQATKNEMAVWYNRFHWVTPEVFKKVCDWYERQPGQKFTNGFYSAVRPRCLEFSGDHSATDRNWERTKAISPEKVKQHQIALAKKMKQHRLEGPRDISGERESRKQERKTVKELARYVVRGTEPPSTDKKNAARQIADLEEFIKTQKETAQ